MTSPLRKPGRRDRVTVTWKPERGATAEDISQVLDLPIVTLFDVDLVVNAPLRIWAQDTTVRTSKPVTISYQTGEFAVHVQAPDWVTVCERVTHVVLALVAHLRGMMYLHCPVASTLECADRSILLASRYQGTGTEPLTLRGPHVLVDANSGTPTAHIVAAEILWRQTGPVVDSVTIVAVAVVCEDPGTYLSPKTIHSHLRAHLGVSGPQLAAVTTGPGGAGVLADIDRANDTHLHSLATAVPAVCVDAVHLFDWAHHGDLDALIGPAPAQYSRAGLDQLRAMQHTAGQVYGRLEPARAMAWTAEEVGEVAKAIRRRESPARITEELGQLFNWLLCLANIAECDIAECADRALQHEGRRQVGVHGALRPARSGPFRASS